MKPVYSYGYSSKFTKPFVKIGKTSKNRLKPVPTNGFYQFLPVLTNGFYQGLLGKNR